MSDVKRLTFIRGVIEEKTPFHMVCYDGTGGKIVRYLSDKLYLADFDDSSGVDVTFSFTNVLTTGNYVSLLVSYFSDSSLKTFNLSIESKTNTIMPSSTDNSTLFSLNHIDATYNITQRYCDIAYSFKRVNSTNCIAIYSDSSKSSATAFSGLQVFLIPDANHMYYSSSLEDTSRPSQIPILISQKNETVQSILSSYFIETATRSNKVNYFSNYNDAIVYYDSGKYYSYCLLNTSGDTTTGDVCSLQYDGKYANSNGYCMGVTSNGGKCMSHYTDDFRTEIDVAGQESEIILREKVGHYLSPYIYLGIFIVTCGLMIFEMVRSSKKKLTVSDLNISSLR